MSEKILKNVHGPFSGRHDLLQRCTRSKDMCGKQNGRHDEEQASLLWGCHSQWYPSDATRAGSVAGNCARRWRPDYEGAWHAHLRICSIEKRIMHDACVSLGFELLKSYRASRWWIDRGEVGVICSRRLEGWILIQTRGTRNGRLSFFAKKQAKTRRGGD